MNRENFTKENMFKVANRIIDYCDIRLHNTQNYSYRRKLFRNYPYNKIIQNITKYLKNCGRIL